MTAQHPGHPVWTKLSAARSPRVALDHRRRDPRALDHRLRILGAPGSSPAALRVRGPTEVGEVDDVAVHGRHEGAVVGDGEDRGAAGYGVAQDADEFQPRRTVLPEGRLVNTTTSGAQIRAVATDSRRFSPPTASWGWRGPRRPGPKTQNRSTWAAVSSAEVPAARGPSSSSSRTVRDTNWYSGSWNTIETRRSNSRDDQAWGSVRPGAEARSSATRTCPAS